MSRRVPQVGVPSARIARLSSRPTRLYPELVHSVTFGGAKTVTASATPHTAGAWTELISATSAPCDWVYLWGTGSSSSTLATEFLVDIGVGASGSEVVVAPSLPAGYHQTDDNIRANPVIGAFPLNIPQGSRVAARCQAAIASDIVSINAAFYFQGLQCGSVIDTYGADLATSRGVNMPTSNTYAQITSGTTQPYQALVMLATGAGSTFTSEESIYTMAIGASGAEVAVASASVYTHLTETIRMEPAVVIYPRHVPAGTRIAGKQTVGSSTRGMIVLGVRY